MSPQTTEHITATPPPATKELIAPPPKPQPAARPGKGKLFWTLLALGAVLNLAIVGVGYALFSHKSVPPPKERKITVPFAANKELWQRWGPMPTQDDGRIKPFQSFCVETVRYITEREKFEGNDPVAVVVSWIMTYQPEPTKQKIDYDDIEARSK